MRKIFTLLAAMVCSFASFAQDIQLETKDGQVIENGSTVTIHGEMEDMMIWGQFNSNLHVRNLTDKKQGVYATMKVVSGTSQICWGGSCVPVMVGNSHTTGMGVVDAESSSSLLIETLVMDADYMNAIVSCTIEITVWTDKNPDQKVSATVTYTNDPASGIESTEVNSPVVYTKDNVLYCNAAANAQLQVYNVAGNLCKNIRMTSESESLSLEGLNKGIYIYRVLEAGKSAVSGKFLVK
ncbi:MAG: T9SS type A sorting domain-containing protein [Bacteroidaceae bacterium]|nr:T9SS type A sorting domain-containing protein [Bacteroidaceae bacterium]